MEPRGTIGFELRELSILMIRFIEKEKSQNGLGDIQKLQAWTLGYMVKHNDRPVFSKDLEKEFSIRKSTASNLVKRMEKNGFIEIKKGTQEDKRLKELVLTEKAYEQIQAFNYYADKLEEKITANLSDQELEQFKNTLNKIKSNFDEC